MSPGRHNAGVLSSQGVYWGWCRRFEESVELEKRMQGLVEVISHLKPDVVMFQVRPLPLLEPWHDLSAE